MKSKAGLISIVMVLVVLVSSMIFSLVRNNTVAIGKNAIENMSNQETETAPMIERLACLNEMRVASVRADPGRGIAIVFEACDAELTKKAASLRLTEEEKRIVFLSVLANAMAPYGPSQSIALKDLLNDKVMDCDNYAMLAGYFSRILEGIKSRIDFVGFDGGAVGNHAQLFVDSGNGLMLDPTIGLVARIGFDDLMMGKAISNDQILIFRQHEDNILDGFVSRVHDAVLNGKYRPRNLLYFFNSLEDYLKFSEEIAPLWGGDVNILLSHFPTPAAEALRKNLAGQGLAN